MKRTLQLVAWGCAGILLAGGLTGAAVAAAGNDLATPIRPFALTADRVQQTGDDARQSRPKGDHDALGHASRGTPTPNHPDRTSTGTSGSGSTSGPGSSGSGSDDQGDGGGSGDGNDQGGDNQDD